MPLFLSEFASPELYEWGHLAGIKSCSGAADSAQNARRTSPFILMQLPPFHPLARSGKVGATLAGTRANATLAGELFRPCGGRVDHDALAITVEGAESVAAVEQAVRPLTEADASGLLPQVEEAALEGLKFSECLPTELALATLASRLRDEPAVRAILSQPARVINGA
jgi:ATP-dependent Lhr-like helicase